MISDLILCHKVRKLFAIIITQKEEIRSQIYRKTRFILSIEKQIFLTNCSRIFLSRIESLLLANIHIRFMNKKHLFALLFTLLVWTSCNNQQHFITDAAYRAEVENDFQAKQAALPNGNLFAVFNDQMTPEEREALTFMYAYMPIGDITDYSGDFYLKNIRSSFQARNEMPWGDSIPEDIFRHFVLPVRINNENLDESRMVFFDELKDRVKGLSLYDAVLEVNHWCHEKVIYTPSDGRTSSPLASVKTAYGRCGEESTFTVAALRSVGIPARQVYTPRWAHTDDNHAWVEAWVNGVSYKIYKATKGGEPIGAAVESSANGFGGALTVLVGFDNDGNIIDYSLLSHAETPGLGSKAADWFKKGAKGDITGKNPGEAALTVSKDGGQIDAITASTITSRAFLLAVNNAYAAYKNQYVDSTSGATSQAASQEAEASAAADSTNVENN